MAALGHFIFELVKIGILSVVYTLIVVAAMRIANRLPAEKKPKRKRVFLKIYKWIFAVLFVFMFTYWGNHGLGDDSNVPIGHFKTVNQVDAHYSYIEASKNKQYNIGKYIVKDDILYAETGGNAVDKSDYTVWNLTTDTVAELGNSEYLNDIAKYNYPAPDKFSDFNKYYDLYWNGWRFWLLP